MKIKRRKNYLDFLNPGSMSVETEKVVTHYPAPPHLLVVS